MGLLDKLVQAQMALPNPVNAFTVDVSGASDAQVLGTLVTAFGADDGRAEIQVLRDGALLGSVKREAAIAVLGDGLKGVGSSDGMLLPGVPNYNTSTWVCALPGCGYTLVTIVLGLGPRCARHPGQALTQKN